MYRWPTALMLMLLAACSTQPALQQDEADRTEGGMQWPTAATQARIELRQVFASPTELGYRARFAARFKRFLGGGGESRPDSSARSRMMETGIPSDSLRVSSPRDMSR